MYILCMEPTLKLSVANREFFSMVARAAFTNPFSQERMDVDRQIIGAAQAISRDELVSRTIAQVEKRVHNLMAEGKADLRRYLGEDREIVRTVVLFDVYHRFRFEFDALILRQIESGDTPCQVPFARDVFSSLAAQGISDDDARRYFAIFYQIRRAFFFIENGLTGLAPSMDALRLHLWDNVFTSDITWYENHLWNRMEDFSTLLLGETGTGKGAAASAIGRSGFIPFDERKQCFSESFTRNFISLNLSQYPESLLESELFGHKKGAFTGAIENHEGIFARCTPHGSIFLDEIGDVSIPVQIKLLQILQERTFSPVGSHDRVRFHGRVIAATHKPLDEMRQHGLFRDDFYYRLCSDIITVPPLRQRLQEEPRELELLVAGILTRMIGTDGKSMVGLVCEIINKDVRHDYPWEGNVRELEQAVRRIILTRHYVGDRRVAPINLREQLFAGIESGTKDAQTLLAEYCCLLYRQHGTFEEVARRTGLDRRTVKKYIRMVASDSQERR